MRQGTAHRLMRTPIIGLMSPFEYPEIIGHRGTGAFPREKRPQSISRKDSRPDMKAGREQDASLWTMATSDLNSIGQHIKVRGQTRSRFSCRTRTCGGPAFHRWPGTDAEPEKWAWMVARMPE